MKHLILFIAIFIAGCSTQQTDQLTPLQKNQIKSEVKAVAESLMANLGKLDAEGWIKYYADTPDWVMYGPDGASWDFQTFKKASLEIAGSASAYKYATIQKNYIVISKDVVIWAVVAKDEYTMKSGDKMRFDSHPYTLVFKKIAGQWKVIYSHDSGVPVMQKAGKK